MLCVLALGFLLSSDGFLFPDFSAALFRIPWVESFDFFAASAAVLFDELESELEPSELPLLSELLSESSLICNDTLQILKN